MQKPVSIVDTCKSTIQTLFSPKKQKVIEEWDFIMIFQLRYKEEIQAYFQKYMGNTKNKYKLIVHDKQEELLVLIGIEYGQVLRQAAELKILKKKKKKSFAFDLTELNRQIYLAEEEKNTWMCNYLKWIRARMMPGNQKIYQQQKYSVFNVHKKQSYIAQKGTLFTSEEELRTKYNFLLNFSVKQKNQTVHQDAKIYPLTDIMRHAGFKEIVAVHKDSKYGSIIFGSIKQYVGANSQTYFDFVNFLQRWLIFPAVIGLMTVFFNIFFNYTAQDSPGDFLYALVIMVWSVIFISRWQHQQKWTAACQQTGYSQEWTEHQDIVDRSGCKARQSRISGQKQLYVPFLQKTWRYCVSVTICMIVLIGTLIFMVLSLNARGFVDEKHKFLYSQTISGWAQPGGVFDANTAWGQIPNLIHVLVTNIFDEAIYRPLAKKFTKYEQHFQSKSYQNSIIIKYFVYEYIITFADLFYIAFVRMDIIGLREQLLSLFFIDIIRRIVAQLLIPKIKSKIRKYFIKPSVSNEAEVQDSELATQAILQVSKQDYEPFDDYLQIVTNFGYLAMISSCFPLAPLLILFAHSIQSLQDKYKIVHIFRRKLPKKYVGMGHWNNIVVFLCYTSIVTNILLFAFSSHQIVTLFPKLYESGKDILLGNVQFTDIVQDAASSVLNAVLNATTPIIEAAPSFQQFIEDATPFTATQCNDYPIVQSFLPPAEQYELQFVSILFIIEHVFLMIFLCLRNILSKQKCKADLLLQRRHMKRGIKKYLNKEVLAGVLRDSIVSVLEQKIINVEEEKNNFLEAFLNLGKNNESTSSSIESQGSDVKSQ